MFPVVFDTKYGFFIIFFVMLLMNGILARVRVQPYIKKDPALENGYNLMIAGTMVVYLLPLMALLLAVSVEKTNTIFDILDKLNAAERNPFMFLFFLIVIAEAVTYFAWIVFLGGAAFIEQYPGLLRGNGGRYTAREIKIQAILSVVIVIAALVFIPYFQSKFMTVMK